MALEDSLTPKSRKSVSSGILCLEPVTKEEIESLPFEFCIRKDLNEFFKFDALLYQDEFLSVTYKLTIASDQEQIIGLVSLSNDTLKFKTNSQKQKKIHHHKFHIESYPAVKIGRLGIKKELKGNGFGRHAIELLSSLFRFENRTGCRFITVDSYYDVVEFYEKCGFKILNEGGKNQEEMKAMIDDELKIDPKTGKTIAMFYHLPNQAMIPICYL